MDKIEAVGFDNSSFERKKSNRKNISKEKEKFHGFYSPLGVGVGVKNLELFNKAYLGKIKELKKDFDNIVKKINYALGELNNLKDKIFTENDDLLKLRYGSFRNPIFTREKENITVIMNASGHDPELIWNLSLASAILQMK